MSNNIKKVIFFGIGYIVIKWTIIGTIGISLYKSGYWSNWYFIVIPLFGIVFFNLIGKRLFKIQVDKPYKIYFSQELKKLYPDIYIILLEEIDTTYKVISKDIYFSYKSKNPIDKRLDFSAYFLSFIKVIEKEGVNFEQIRTACLDITKEYIKPKSSLQAWLKRIPPKLINTKLAKPILSIMAKKFKIRGHKNGFVALIITDKKETYGFGYGLDITECGICKLFNNHDAMKYSSILCEIDLLTSSLAGLKLIRTGTIANGAPRCDFRFKKIEITNAD